MVGASAPRRIAAPALLVIALLAPLALAACTWVEPTSGGREVRVREESEVSGCESKGTASTRTADSIGFIWRSDWKVREELVTLGRNEAARLGGNTIVPLGEAEHGEQSFAVYRCP